MSDPIAPGRYAFPGTSQVLVIEGTAYFEPQSTPQPLPVPGLPATPAATVPTTSPASSIPEWLKWVAIIFGSLAAGRYVGPAIADKVISPDPPAVVVNVPAAPVKPARPPGTQNHSPSGPNYHPFGAMPESGPVFPSPQLPQ